MTRFALAVGISFLSLGGAVSSLQGAAANQLTLTPDGTNTNFAITGTYPSNFPITFYSSPNASYSLNFTLPTTPTALDFVDPADGIFAITTAVMLNSLTFPDSQIAFFTPSLGGGLDVCLSDVCSPNPPTSLSRFEVFGDPLFTGDVSSPTFIAGIAGIDTTQSHIEAPVPEPTSFALSGIAGVLASLSRIRKRRHVIVKR